jgi:hypothetical protein
MTEPSDASKTESQLQSELNGIITLEYEQQIEATKDVASKMESETVRKSFLEERLTELMKEFKDQDLGAQYRAQNAEHANHYFRGVEDGFRKKLGLSEKKDEGYLEGGAQTIMRKLEGLHAETQSEETQTPVESDDIVVAPDTSTGHAPSPLTDESEPVVLVTPSSFHEKPDIPAAPEPAPVPPPTVATPAPADPATTPSAAPISPRTPLIALTDTGRAKYDAPEKKSYFGKIMIGIASGVIPLAVLAGVYFMRGCEKKNEPVTTQTKPLTTTEIRELSESELENAVLERIAEGKMSDAQTTFESLVKKSPAYSALQKERKLEGGLDSSIIDSVYQEKLGKVTKAMSNDAVVAASAARNEYDLGVQRKELAPDAAATNKRITLYELVEWSKK